MWSTGRRQLRAGLFNMLSGGLRGGMGRSVEQSAVVKRAALRADEANPTTPHTTIMQSILLHTPQTANHCCMRTCRLGHCAS